MLKQRFLLYRDLADKEPHLRKMAPLSACLHVALLLLALGVNYYLNGMVWTLGGPSGGGGGNPEISVIAPSSGGALPPTMTQAPPKPTPPEPEPEKPKPEPEKPKPEPEKPKKAEEEKPKPDPEAVQVPTKPEPKKEEKKPEPKKEEKKPEPKKEPPKPKDPPKPPVKEPPKPQPEKKEVPKTATKPTAQTKQGVQLATTAGTKPGPSPLAGGGPNGEGVGLPGPGGMSNLPSYMEGWGQNVFRVLQPIWSRNQPGGLRRDPENYAEVEFVISRDGNLLGEPKITRPGIDPEVAELALKTLQMARKLPALPESFPAPTLTIRYRFVPPQ